MPDTTTTTTTDTTPTAADAAVGASAVVTADKPADTWTPPATKADYDKAITDAVSVAEGKYKAPDKYEGLKLPDKITVDPALIERTAATARSLGLPQDKAQGFVDFVAQEAARETAAALSAYSPPSTENPEGGARWKEQNDAWRAASLSDPELGNGKPEQLQVVVDRATKVLAKFGDEKSIAFIDSVLGSSPDALRVLNRIGLAMGEQGLVKPTGERDAAPKKLSEIMYPHGAGLAEGDPRLAQA